MRRRPAARWACLAALLVGPARAAAAAEQSSPAAAPAKMSLAEAYAVLAAHKKVDLTHAFGPGTPVSPRFGHAKMTPAVDPATLEAYTIARDGFRATYFAMVGQYGTHVDPPAFMAPTGATMDDIPLDQMMLPLVVLDDTPFLAKDPAHAFSLDDLAAWEGAHGRVPTGAFVALRTDMSRDYETDPARFGRMPFPGWSLPVVKALFEERGAVAIGQESMRADATRTMDSAAYLLSRGHFDIDEMANLDKLPATGAVLVVTWPKVKGGLGFPARAFAILP